MKKIIALNVREKIYPEGELRGTLEVKTDFGLVLVDLSHEDCNRILGVIDGQQYIDRIK